MRLSNSQKSALLDIAASPGKSGGFWADLGHPAVTLLSLERKSLLRADSRGYSSSRQWQFWATEEGHAWLRENEE